LVLGAEWRGVKVMDGGGKDLGPHAMRAAAQTVRCDIVIDRSTGAKFRDACEVYRALRGLGDVRLRLVLADIILAHNQGRGRPG